MDEHGPAGRLVLVMMLAGLATAAMGVATVVRFSAGRFSYDSALAFLICGVGLMAALYSRRLAVASALIVILIVAGSLVRAAFHGGFWSRLVSAIPSSLAEPVVPRLSACLLLVSLGLLLIALGGRLQHRSLMVGLVGSAVAGVGLASLLEDVIQLQHARLWPILGHPGAALLLLATGILAFAWQDKRTAAVGPAWLPLAIAICVASVTLVLWQAQAEREQSQMDAALESETARVQERLAEQMETRLLALIQLARRWEVQGAPRKEHWESDARLVVGQNKGYEAIEWIDPSFRVQWFAGDDTAQAHVGLDAARDESERELLKRARDGHEVLISRSVMLPAGDSGFYLYVPIISSTGFEGLVRGVLSYKGLFDSLFREENERQFLVAVFDGAQQSYGPPPPPNGYSTQRADVALFKVPWTLVVWPSAKLLEQMNTPLDEAILITGLSLALLLALAVRLAQQARSREHQVSATNRELEREIEQRERTELRLGENNAYLNALIASSPMAILAYDTQGNVTLANPAFERIFGYPAQEIIGRPLDDFIASREAAAEARRLTAAVFAGETVHVATRRRRADGSEVDVEIFGVPLVVDGKIFSAYALYQDISKRRRTEEALAHERDLLQVLMDSFPDRIFFKDRDSRFTRINMAHARSLGVASPEEAIGKTDFDFDRPNSAQFFAEEQQIIRTAHPLIGKIERSEKAGGVVRFSSVTKVPILDKNGEPAGVVGITRDITDWMKAKEALLESEARYRVLFDSSPYPMFVADLETLGYLAVNEAAVRHYGYSAEEFTAMKLADIRPPEEVPRLLEHLGANDSEPFVTRHRKKDGTIIEVEVTARTVVFGGRQARMILANDVTEKRQLEERFRQSQKMEAVGRLAGGVAHDFNNLLTVIIGYSDLLLTRLSTAAGDSRMARAAEEIHKAAGRGASLTRQLLAFSRRQVLQPKVLDLNSVVANTEKMLRRLIGEDIELATHLDPALGWVKADPGQVEQVLLNLAVNARDAMPGGGRLTLETSNTELDHMYSTQHVSVQPGRYVMLAVCDSGCGMSPDVMTHLFEPFFTTKQAGKGTGLGLATVYGIVKQSGGYIWAYSEPGQGSTFKVYLPRIDQPEQLPSAAPAAVRELPRGTETILLVEDEEVVRTLVREVLERNGYHVLVASNGNQALQISAAHAGPIHLLLTDVVMAGMNGRELVQRLTPLRSETRILFMSGYTDDNIVKQGMLEVGSAFLQKPFTAAVLARKVRDLLDAPRASSAAQAD